MIQKGNYTNINCFFNISIQIWFYIKLLDKEWNLLDFEAGRPNSERIIIKPKTFENERLCQNRFIRNK